MGQAATTLSSKVLEEAWGASTAEKSGKEVRLLLNRLLKEHHVGAKNVARVVWAFDARWRYSLADTREILVSHLHRDMLSRSLQIGVDDYPEEDGGEEEENSSKHQQPVGIASDGCPFECLSKDVILMIVEYVSDTPAATGGMSAPLLAAQRPSPPPPPPPFSSHVSSARRLELQERLDVARRLATCLCTLARVNCAFHDSFGAANETLWQSAAEKAKFSTPQRLWSGATTMEIFRHSFRMLRQEYEAEMQLSDLHSTPRPPPPPCGMPPPVLPGRPMPRIHLPDFQSWSRAISPAAHSRIVSNSHELLDFLRAFLGWGMTTDNWAESALLRYRMFLQLQKEHPNDVLIPTGDILFAQIAHICRTEMYWSDIDESMMPDNALQLDEQVQKIYVEASLSTARLWRQKFNCEYVPSTFKIGHVYFDVKKTGSIYRLPDFIDFHKPPAYLMCIGPSPPQHFVRVADLGVSISLTLEQLKQDIKWLPALEREVSSYRTYSWGLGYTGGDMHERFFRTYVRFLYLVRKHSEAVAMAPPTSIDLCWHAHQLTPKLYKSEITKILGHHQYHDPWPNERANLEDLQCLWKQEFNTEVTTDHELTESPGGSDPPPPPRIK